MPAHTFTALRTAGLYLFLAALAAMIALLFATRISPTETHIAALTEGLSEQQAAQARAAIEPLAGKSTPKFEAIFTVSRALAKAKWSDYQRQDFLFRFARTAGTGLFWSNAALFSWLIIGLGVLGGLLYHLPKFVATPPGIRHDGIFLGASTNAGWIGMATAAFLIGFYILLYFYHFLIAEWIALADPFSMALRNEPASQWFMYGFLYTLAIVVMGIRMLAQYRHSNYHRLRTASVMFFQLSFAFIIPQILYRLHLPEDDLKNIWPLNYYFFFDWNIQKHLDSGVLGVFMLGWGIALAAVGVPLLTWFFGKRWYCSWVCGCGGLAETLGDPYRQLSDKSTEAWQIERVVIHGVLAFAVVMTAIVLYTFFAGKGIDLKINRWVFLAGVWAAGAGLYGYHRWKFPYMKGHKVLAVVLVFAGALTLGATTGYFQTAGASLAFKTYDVQRIYGFAISSIFAGVVGTGFYPLMGSRVWCRFGCPLAAYLGLVQRFQSRFKITTNGGQCISCGNCSTYCEMGIDVRAYAQRGEDIVRSSCVGCGVCSAVCPRGVLALEVKD